MSEEQFLALSRREKSALAVLAHFHRMAPNQTYGFHAGFLGRLNAAALRNLALTGLVTIDRQAVNCFRYSLSEKGKEWERLNGGVA